MNKKGIESWMIGLFIVIAAIVLALVLIYDVFGPGLSALAAKIGLNLGGL